MLRQVPKIENLMELFLDVLKNPVGKEKKLEYDRLYSEA